MHDESDPDMSLLMRALLRYNREVVFAQKALERLGAADDFISIVKTPQVAEHASILSLLASDLETTLRRKGLDIETCLDETYESDQEAYETIQDSCPQCGANLCGCGMCHPCSDEEEEEDQTRKFVN